MIISSTTTHYTKWKYNDLITIDMNDDLGVHNYSAVSSKSE